MKKNSVVHFEMPYENHVRLAKFYTTVFGWQINKLGSDMGDYVLAGTTEMDNTNMIKTPGTINGGFFPRSPEIPPYPSVVISVDDVREAMKNIIAGGGKVHGEPQEIPDIGQMVSFTDTEGNRASIIQPVKM